MSILKDQEVASLFIKIAESASLDARLAGLRLNMDKLKEAINRSERDGFCSGQAAEAARQELEPLSDELNILVLEHNEFNQQHNERKRQLNELKRQLRAAEKASKRAASRLEGGGDGG